MIKDIGGTFTTVCHLWEAVNVVCGGCCLEHAVFSSVTAVVYALLVVFSFIYPTTPEPSQQYRGAPRFRIPLFGVTHEAWRRSWLIVRVLEVVVVNFSEPGVDDDETKYLIVPRLEDLGL